MALGSELFVLGIYLTQQAGVMLGVGAETVLLVAYLLGLRSRPESHDVYVRAARWAQRVGLGVIITSGLGAVGLHVAASQWGVIAAPAFVFKWILIGVVLAMYPLEGAVASRSTLVQSVVRGIAGGNWYALFLVHSVAPVLSWSNLFLMYAAWMALFLVVWAGFVMLMRRAPAHLVSASPTPAPAVDKLAPKLQPMATPNPLPTAPARPMTAPKPPTPKPAPATPKPMPAPVVPHASLPAVAHEELEAPHHTATPAPPAPPKAPMHPPPAQAPKAPAHVAATLPPLPPKEGEGLPALQIMPKTPEEIDTQNLR